MKKKKRELSSSELKKRAIRAQVGRKIGFIMKSEGFTSLVEVAEKTGIKQKTLAKVIKGDDYNIKDLIKISNSLGIKVKMSKKE